jgi:hypothetical protein
MHKSLIAIATALLAATTLFASAAEAGMKVRLGFGFPLGSFTAHGNSGGSYSKHSRKKRHHYVRRQVKDKVKVTKKSTATKSVAKAEPEPKIVTVDEVAETENSSISTAAIAPVEKTATEDGAEAAPEPVAGPETKPAEVPKSAKKLDCKKFFPSVGMTLSVPCE